MTWISPRASAGFKIFEASIEPSAPPAPIRVCNSSIKRITSCSRYTSSKIFFMRSSNSPRYFVPATTAPMSNIIRRFSAISSGTSPLTMRCANPSTIAVFPTPGSPTRTGLFFVRRLMIWIMRRTSSSRPTTGSILPSRANSVKSRAKLFNVGVPSCEDS